jgi:23S rRNA (uracil1939-C5)-methyltransferase
MEAAVEITGLAYGGSGVGRINGKVVFVPYTAPGDKARIEITSEKKGFSQGRLVEILSPSPSRVTAPCRYFGRCGGCALQHISYPVQVEWKDRTLRETLKRIGKAEALQWDPPVPSPREFGYRTRARFHADGPRFGFYEPDSHRVVDIEECPVLDPALNAALSGIRGAFRADGLNPSILKGFEIGTGGSGKAVASFDLSRNPPALLKALEKITALKGFELRGPHSLTSGDVTLEYFASGIESKTRIRAFSQVNLPQNENLIKKALEYCGLAGMERVLDLFSGTGNLTIPLARVSKEATGVESNGEAVKLAVENAARNRITSARYVEEDAAGWLARNIKALEKERPHVVVLDPPRGGDPEAAGLLAALKPKKIIYVSCSPPTLARDISMLAGSGYRLFRAGMLDMFPQTYHIENVAGLELEK